MSETKTSQPGRGRTKRGASDEFWTPRDVIAELERRNGKPYAIDFAANARNKVAPRWFSKRSITTPQGLYRGGNSLKWDWAHELVLAGGPGWCNPPFSKPNLPLFATKALDAAPYLPHQLDLLLPVSPRAGWFRRVWQGEAFGYHAINDGPLRGQAIRLKCGGYQKELIFLGYSLRFLENGRPADGALGSHVIMRLERVAT